MHRYVLSSRPYVVLLVLLIFPAIRPLAGEPAAAIRPSANAMGRLNIEGKAVKRLILLKKIGSPDNPANIPIFQESPRSIENPEHPSNQVILEHPAPSVLLPEGEYTVTGIELDGGYQSTVPSVYFDIDTGAPRARILERTDFVISAKKACSIKVGLPFQPTVTATRRGSALLLEYRLTDAGGHTYFRAAWDKPPATVIDGTIVSG
jgi:hypothetical protein